ncbi:hypothetical protein CCZ01_04745 [Helicobacter monodelphidis]|nr:hypothetical protein CCZ01_04745 [Helicobacter sp. 15-1451]
MKQYSKNIKSLSKDILKYPLDKVIIDSFTFIIIIFFMMIACYFLILYFFTQEKLFEYFYCLVFIAPNFYL